MSKVIIELFYKDNAREIFIAITGCAMKTSIEGLLGEIPSNLKND